MDLSELIPKAGFKQRVTFSVSTNWTVPAGIYYIAIYATGGGGGGSGGSSASGGSGSNTIINYIGVTPGEVLNIVIGAGGLGATSNGSPSGTGGHTYVKSGNRPMALSLGGNCPPSSGSAAAPAMLTVSAGLKGGTGGRLDASESIRYGGAVEIPTLWGAGASQQSSASQSIPGAVAANNGGGGSSYYGPGGNGNSAGNGANASYAGAGGGAGGATAKGGNGANGYVEIFY